MNAQPFRKGNMFDRRRIGENGGWISHPDNGMLRISLAPRRPTGQLHFPEHIKGVVLSKSEGRKEVSTTFSKNAAQPARELAPSFEKMGSKVADYFCGVARSLSAYPRLLIGITATTVATGLLAIMSTPAEFIDAPSPIIIGGLLAATVLLGLRDLSKYNRR